MQIFHHVIISTSALAKLKAGGAMLKTVAGSGLTKAVTVAAQAGNPIGAATIAAVLAAEETGKPGAEKRADVIAAVAPVIVKEAAKGGFTALETDAEQFAGLVVEEVVSTMKQTPTVQIGEALLGALGIA